MTGLVENAEHTDGFTVTDNTVSDCIFYLRPESQSVSAERN